MGKGVEDGLLLFTLLSIPFQFLNILYILHLFVLLGEEERACPRASPQLRHQLNQFNLGQFCYHSITRFLLFTKSVSTRHPRLSQRACSKRLNLFFGLDLLYIGCYERDCFQNNISFTIISINECTGSCRHESYQYAALEFGDTCYCGNFKCADKQSEKQKCNSFCGVQCALENGKFLPCGGIGFIQVYMGKYC